MRKFDLLLHAAAEMLEPDRGPGPYAVGLAAAMEAHLTALVFQLHVALPDSAIALAGRTPLVGHDARQRDALRRAEVLREQALARGVPIELVTTHSNAYTVPQVVADHARLCDLAVAGVSDAGLLSERVIAEHVLFQSGRPLLAVPQRHERAFACERITVAWDGERTAARALGDALPFLQRASEVVLLTVGGDKAIDSSVSRELALAVLKRRGVAARFEQVERGERTIGDAIQHHAVQHGSDLLVMGAYGHARFRDFVLGGATRRVLGAPALPTLLAH